MGIGVGVFLIAVGAILTFAVHVTTSGFNIHTVGVILMIAGALGLVVTMTIFAPRRRATTVEERTVSRDPLVPGGAVTRERVTEHREVY
jgi:Domain of unknown function (DUF6458)